MPMLPASPQLTLYVVCSVVLSLQMLFLGALTAATRAKNKHYMNPEDGAVSSKEATFNEGAEHPDTARVQRAHRNLLESIPMFFALGLICLITGASPLGTQIALGAFTGARVLHSIVYIKGVQPWRTMFFAVGLLSLVAMAVLSLIAVFA